MVVMVVAVNEEGIACKRSKTVDNGTHILSNTTCHTQSRISRHAEL